MITRSIVFTTATVILCGFTFSGCGQSNESGFKGESRVVPPRADLPNFTNYSEVAQYTMQKAKEEGKKGVKKGQ